MKRRTLIITVCAGLLLILGAAGGVGFYWLCYTESGLHWLVGRASNLKTVQLHIDGLQGRLSGPIRIERLEIVHDRAHIVASGIRVHLQLRNLAIQTVYADEFHADSAEIVLKPRTKPSTKRKPRFLPIPWLAIRSDAIEIGRTHLTLQNGQVFEARRVTGEGRLTSGRVRMKNIRVTGLTPGQGADENSLRVAIEGSGELRAANPIGIGGDLQWTAQLQRQPDYSGRLQFTGTLAKLDFTGNLLQPHYGSLRGTALDLTGRWHWTAQVLTPAFDFKPWSPQSGLGTFVVTLAAKGDRESLQVNGRIEPQALAALGPMELSLNGAYAKRRLRTDRLEVHFVNRGGTVVTAGEILFAGGFPTVQLHGQWSQLTFPASAPAVSSRQGDLTLEGQLPYAFTVSGDLSGARVPASKFSSRGSIDRDRLTVDAFEARFINASAAPSKNPKATVSPENPPLAKAPSVLTREGIAEGKSESPLREGKGGEGKAEASAGLKGKDGLLTGSGELIWGQQNTWQFRFDARELNPDIFNRAFPGKVSFSLAGSGRGFEPTGPWQLKLDGLHGQMRTQALSGHGQVSRNGKVWQLGATQLQFGNARLTASGSYDKQPNLQWLFSAEDLSQLLPETHGRLYSQGKLSGSSEQPQLTASLRGTGLKYQQYRIGAIEADTDINLQDNNVQAALDRGRLNLQLNATELGVDTRSIRSLRVSLEGTAANHQLQAQADAGNAQLDITAQGAYGFPQGQTQRTKKRVRQWQGTVSQLKVVSGKVRLALEAPAPMVLGPERVEVNAFCLSGNDARACGNAHWKTGGMWTGQIKVQSLPLRLFSAGLPPRAQYSGPLSLNAQLDAEQQRFTASVNLDPNETAELTGQAAADRRPGIGWRQFPLTGSVRARTRELSFVPALVPEVDRASGELSASFNLAGTLGAPQFNGTLALDKGEMDLFTVNLLLRDIGMRLDLHGNTLKLKANARAGEGSAAVEGQLAWQAGAPKGSLTLKGENLVIANVPEARIHASPDITVNIDGRDIQVDGAVRVPYARLAPANLSGAVLSSSDEVIAGTPPEDPKKSFRVTTGVHLILGNDVRIDSYGLSGRLTGSIALYTAPDELSTGIGELRIVENREGVEGQESKYVAYGRELDIERGRLIFTGGALSNPGVDIRASLKVGERATSVTAGVNVRGTLRNPRLSFFSDPPLPQSQIASLLVSGQTVFDPLQNSATQSSSSQAREQLFAQGGALLARQLGIDDVTVESDAAESTSLMLGKYLSPRLYVGYGISLAEAINTLKLRYTLGDRWTIKIEAGENRSADVVYSIDR